MISNNNNNLHLKSNFLILIKNNKKLFELIKYPLPLTGISPDNTANYYLKALTKLKKLNKLNQNLRKKIIKIKRPKTSKTPTNKSKKIDKIHPVSYSLTIPSNTIKRINISSLNKKQNNSKSKISNVYLNTYRSSKTKTLVFQKNLQKDKNFINSINNNKNHNKYKFDYEYNSYNYYNHKKTISDYDNFKLNEDNYILRGLAIRENFFNDVYHDYGKLKSDRNSNKNRFSFDKETIINNRKKHDFNEKNLFKKKIRSFSGNYKIGYKYSLKDYISKDQTSIKIKVFK